MIGSCTTTPVVCAGALAYSPAVAATVVATGRHFIADIAGGTAVVLPARIVARCITRAGCADPHGPADA